MEISEDDLLEVCCFAVKQAIEKGADEAEAYGMTSIDTEASIEQNDLTLSKFQQSSGIGIRVLQNKAIGFASINLLSREEVIASVEAALKIASKSSFDPYNIIPVCCSIRKISGLLDPEIENLRSDDAVTNGVTMLKTAREYDRRVTVDSGSFNCSLSTHSVANSNGAQFVESISSYQWYIMGMALDGSEVSSFNFQFDGTHHLKNVNVVDTALRFAENAVNSLGARKCEPFKGTIVISPQASIELIIPALVSSINSNNIQKGRSNFIGRLGEQVGSNELTVTDDATWSEGLAASSFDREGIAHRPLSIIEDGVLRSYIFNTYTANRVNVDSTGHASGDYQTSPHIGETNILVKYGSHSIDKLIEEVRRGILATRFSGNVNPISGDFSGVVKGGHLIEDGEKVHSLKETLIAGNIFGLLNSISGISKERCRIFNYLLPYIRAEGISVTSG